MTTIPALREEIARVIDPDCWEQIDRDAHLLPDKVKTDWVKAQPSLAKADAILALLLQPSQPGEYAALIATIRAQLLYDGANWTDTKEAQRALDQLEELLS